MLSIFFFIKSCFACVLSRHLVEQNYDFSCEFCESSIHEKWIDRWFWSVLLSIAFITFTFFYKNSLHLFDLVNFLLQSLRLLDVNIISLKKIFSTAAGVFSAGVFSAGNFSADVIFSNQSHRFAWGYFLRKERKRKKKRRVRFAAATTLLSTSSHVNMSRTRILKSSHEVLEIISTKVELCIFARVRVNVRRTENRDRTNETNAVIRLLRREMPIARKIREDSRTKREIASSETLLNRTSFYLFKWSTGFQSIHKNFAKTSILFFINVRCTICKNVAYSRELF